jgi:6-phosphogluconolactonase
MRWLSFLLLLPIAPSLRAETIVYVSVADEHKIAAYRMADDGKLTHFADTKVPGEPAALTTDPARRFLFASLRAEGKLTSFRIDPKTGKLTAVSVIPAGADPAQVSTDRKGKFLFTAYYVSAQVTVHKIGPNGELSEEPVQKIATADRAHAIMADATNRFVFVPHTGPNAIFQFRFDAKAGRLAPSKIAKIETEKNTGPRHLVFHPTKEIAYVANEQGGSVTAYAFEGGTLKPTQTLSTLPSDFRETNACAEIRIHPTGKFLYVANRGHESIAMFAIDEAGKLTSLGQEPTEKNPRSFDIDPSGKFLYAAGESSGKLASYRIDAKTGKLSRFATLNVGKTPWWVMAVEMPGK